MMYITALQVDQSNDVPAPSFKTVFEKSKQKEGVIRRKAVWCQIKLNTDIY